MEKAKQTFNSTLRSWMFFKLAGPDEIHLRVCRELAWSDLTAHGNYFKNGVRTGKVSENRKKAIIVLTFKKVKRSVDQTISFQLPRKKKYWFKYSNIWMGTRGYESANADLSRTNHVKQSSFFPMTWWQACVLKRKISLL